MLSIITQAILIPITVRALEDISLFFSVTYLYEIAYLYVYSLL